MSADAQVIPSPFHVMAKPIGARCNLDCDYCFYLEKEALYPTSTKPLMSDELLEEYVRQYIISQPIDIVTFAWQGGEPTLLGLDFFERVVALQQRHAKGKRIENTIQTNGVLIDDSWSRFFKEHNFLIGISIDGPESLHNRYRLNKGGLGSFDHVMAGLEALKRHQVEFNTLTTVHRGNVEHPLEVYEFLKHIGSRFIQFIPIVERWHKETCSAGASSTNLQGPTFDTCSRVTEWSVPPDQYGIFLNTVFDQWVRQDVGHTFIQIVDVTLGVWMGDPAGLCVFQETCGEALAIEHNGDLYSCDHYVYEDYLLGNITQSPIDKLALSPAQQAFGRAKKETLTIYCKDCEALPLCNGDCPKHRFTLAPNGEEGLSYLCPSYKNFFSHTAPYMRFMSQELKQKRPATSVMAWARDKEQGFPTLKTGRNEPCPCGSGRKYKHCCSLK